VKPQPIQSADNLAESLLEITRFDAFLTIAAGAMIGSLVAHTFPFWHVKQGRVA